MLLNPDRIYVEDLIERRRLEDGDDHHGDERIYDAALAGREPSALELAPLHSRWQVAVSVEISGKAKEHKDRGDAEAVVPAINLCEHTAEQRSATAPILIAVLKMTKPRVRRNSSSGG